MRRPSRSQLFSVALGSVLLLAGQASSPAVAAERLPSLGVDLGQTTVSGLSSGAFMAVQFHVAFSGIVQGAGVVAGGPYYCAEGQLFTNALNRCMQTRQGRPNPQRLLGLARSFARNGDIDPLENLADDRAYLFSGVNDRTVTEPVVDAARGFYAAAGIPAANLLYRDDLPAGHGMVTERFGASCSRTASPFINDCGFDLAGAILHQLYPGLRPPGEVRAGRVLSFDQTEFFGAPAAAPGSTRPDAGASGQALPWLARARLSLNDTGFAYVPAACAARAAACRVHVVFHGCKQTVDDIGDRYATSTGYNRWADANDLVMLYPQAKQTLPANPNGCWDWWGYSGAGYATKAGPQMATVRAMLGRLAGP